MIKAIKRLFRRVFRRLFKPKDPVEFLPFAPYDGYETEREKYFDKDGVLYHQYKPFTKISSEQVAEIEKLLEDVRNGIWTGERTV